MTTGVRDTSDVGRLGIDTPLTAETSEGAQELHRRRRHRARASSAARCGAVLRLPEGLVLDPTSIDVERPEDETMIINMGPQHPSTHGVLRLMLELDGEFVLRTKPVIGYLHTGMEKTGRGAHLRPGRDERDAHGLPEPDHQRARASRWPWRRLLGVEVPERAVWIRMLMSELNRISSHLVWMATNGMDVGSTSMMIYGLREREMILAFFEKTTGLRMNLNYVRPGGVAADLPDGWEDDVAVICDTIDARTYEYDELLDRPADLPPAHGGRRQPDRRGGARARRHRAAAALDRRALGPAPRDAVPALRPGRLRRDRRAPTATTSTATRSA